MEEPQRRYVVTTIGCRTNQYEAEAFKHQLESLGFVPAQEEEQADLCIIHTCAVTEHAEGSSRHAIRSLVSRHPGSRVVVTGCSAKKNPATLRSIPGVTDVVHDGDVENAIQTLFPEQNIAPFLITRFDDHTRAFVKVQDGCNHFCAYCTVPFLRGPSRSRPLPAIIDEVRSLARGGYQEIVLTGVNLGDYVDGQMRLAHLVRSIDEIPEVVRLRLSSINPNEVDELLVEALVTGRATCPSLHLVAQSGSSKVLQRMGRLYTKEQYLQAVQAIRSRCPDWTFTTDIIVGFPGETDEEFADTLDLIQEVQFAKVHSFPYSSRPKTKGARLKDPVPIEVIRDRKNKVQKISESVAYDLRHSFVGRTMVALTERGEEGEHRFAQTLNGLPVLLPKADTSPNELLRVRLDSNASCALVGSITERCPCVCVN